MGGALTCSRVTQSCLRDVFLRCRDMMPLPRDECLCMLGHAFGPAFLGAVLGIVLASSVSTESSPLRLAALLPRWCEDPSFCLGSHRGALCRAWRAGRWAGSCLLCRDTLCGARLHDCRCQSLAVSAHRLGRGFFGSALPWPSCMSLGALNRVSARSLPLCAPPGVSAALSSRAPR